MPGKANPPAHPFTCVPPGFRVMQTTAPLADSPGSGRHFPDQHLQGRLDLIEVLHHRYGGPAGSGIAMRMKYLRKKYLWKIVTGGANCIKRLSDIAVSLIM